MLLFRLMLQFLLMMHQQKKIGYTKIAGVKIGNGSWVVSGCIILPGTTIGDNVIIGAGPVVRGTIPDNSVAIGNPAKIICSTSEYIEKKKLGNI